MKAERVINDPFCSFIISCFISFIAGQIGGGGETLQNIAIELVAHSCTSVLLLLDAFHGMCSVKYTKNGLFKPISCDFDVAQTRNRK